MVNSTAIEKSLSVLNLSISALEAEMQHDFSDFNDFPIIHEYVQRLFDLIPKKHEITIADIEEMVLPFTFGGTKEELHGNSGCRGAKYVLTRRFVSFFARIMTKMTMKQIGLFYMRDHSSVCVSIDKLLEQMWIYPDMKNYFNIIVTVFEGGEYDMTAIRTAYEKKDFFELLRFCDNKGC